MWVLSHVFGLKLCIAALRLENATISNCKKKMKKNSSPGRKKMQWKSGLLFFKFAFSVFFPVVAFLVTLFTCVSYFSTKCFVFFYVLITLQISSRACKKKNISPKLTQNPQKTLCSATPEFLLCNFLHLYCIIFKLVWLVPECRRAWWPNPFPQHRLKASLRKWPTVSNSFHQRTSRYSKSINRHTIWLFNIAMENHHF